MARDANTSVRPPRWAIVASIVAIGLLSVTLPELSPAMSALRTPLGIVSLVAIVALMRWYAGSPAPQEQVTPEATPKPLPIPAVAPPTAEPAPAEPEQPISPSGFEAFAKELLEASNPITQLRASVTTIREREAAALRDRTQPMPAGLDLYLARGLEEAGLFADDIKLPRIRVVRLDRTKLFYLRVESPTMTYAAKLRILALESALNRTLLCKLTLDDPGSCTLEEVYRTSQRIEASVHHQARRLADAIGPAGGEWGVRVAISTAIESFRLPHRLAVDYRTCVRNRSAAIVVNVTPSEAFPVSCYSPELGRVIPTTNQMREQAASAYAMRIALLLGSFVLESCPQIMHVSVAGILDNARSIRCLYSVRMDRRVVRFVLPDSELSPEQALRVFDANLELENGVLQPVEQGFALEDEEFCPSWRYEPVELSDRPLLYDASTTLAANRTGDLGISEEAHRQEAATKIARRLSDSTEQNVRAVIEVASQDPDLTVRDAASRIVSKLVAGEIAEDDPYALMNEFVEGDDLSQAVRRAWDRLTKGDAEASVRVLQDALSPAEAVGTYSDTDEVVYRSFRSYADRVIYNRTMAKPGVHVELVPASYYGAHLLCASLLLGLDRAEEALAHAKRALELAPEDLHPYLLTSQCHEALGDRYAAADEMGRLLEIAHDPEAAGIAYLRLGLLMRDEERPYVAEACLRRSLEFYSSAYPLAFAELTSMVTADGDKHDPLSDSQIEGLLLANGIPMAPTERTIQALFECARASVDAELFPVARTFVGILNRFTGDDVIGGVVRSIEREPDR